MESTLHASMPRLGLASEDWRPTQQQTGGQPESVGQDTGPSSSPSTPPAGQRLRWTPALHSAFLNCLSMLGGPDHATPKAILGLMKVPGLSIYHVKSHLQQFRQRRALIKLPQKPGAKAVAVTGASSSSAACGAGSGGLPPMPTRGGRVSRSGDPPLGGSLSEQLRLRAVGSESNLVALGAAAAAAPPLQLLGAGIGSAAVGSAPTLGGGPRGAGGLLLADGGGGGLSRALSFPSAAAACLAGSLSARDAAAAFAAGPGQLPPMLPLDMDFASLNGMLWGEAANNQPFGSLSLGEVKLLDTRASFGSGSFLESAKVLGGSSGALGPPQMLPGLGVGAPPAAWPTLEQALAMQSELKRQLCAQAEIQRQTEADLQTVSSYVQECVMSGRA